MLRKHHRNPNLPLFRQRDFVRNSCIVFALQIVFFCAITAVVAHAVPSPLVISIFAILAIISSLCISSVVMRPYMNAAAALKKHYEDSHFGNHLGKDSGQPRFMETAVKTLLTDIDIIQKEHKRLTSLLSHDMRTPMSQVISLCTLLEDEKDADTRELYMQYIKSQSNEMLNMLTDTLHLMQATAVQIKKADVKPLELSSVIKTVMRLLASQIHNKQISVIQDIARELNVLAEEKRFTLAIVQLLAQAIKLSPVNGSIDIKARKISDRIVICISNYDEQNERFSQACDAFEAVPIAKQVVVTRKKPSLYLADQIIAKHNGALVLEEEGNSQYFYQMHVPICAN